MIELSLLDDHKLIQEYTNSNDMGYCIGTDEAGRGALSGPLVVAGVLFDCNTKISGINDSKKISFEKRAILETEIKEKALAYHIQIVSLERIKDLNIYQASKWGMIQCCLEIQKKASVNILLTDAMKIASYELPDVFVIPIIKGDQKSFHIAAASILAKTARDRIMLELHKEFPEYSWDKNKGYPTSLHKKAIRECSICLYHRKGFKLF